MCIGLLNLLRSVRHRQRYLCNVYSYYFYLHIMSRSLRLFLVIPFFYDNPDVELELLRMSREDLYGMYSEGLPTGAARW